MGDPSKYRDSTQIVLPLGALDGLREDLEEQFVVTIFEPDDRDVVRIIGSPVVIKEVSSFLTRHGIHLP
jgi:hypothetical protein